MCCDCCTPFYCEECDAECIDDCDGHEEILDRLSELLNIPKGRLRGRYSEEEWNLGAADDDFILGLLDALERD